MSTRFEIAENIIMVAVGSYQPLGDNIIRKPFLDLNLVFYIGIDDGVAHIVTVEQAEKLGLTAEDLHDIATKNGSYNVMNLGLVSGLDADSPAYVIRNKKAMAMLGGQLADGAIADSRILADLAKNLNDDLYIVPSSIHEIIVVPQGYLNANDLRNLVREVNDTQVKDSDKLSYNLYRYNREIGEIEIAA